MISKLPTNENKQVDLYDKWVKVSSDPLHVFDLDLKDTEESDIIKEARIQSNSISMWDWWVVFNDKRMVDGCEFTYNLAVHAVDKAVEQKKEKQKGISLVEYLKR
jgi:hypothetical protein